MPFHYDLIIIGAGPTGISCAIAAHKAGLSYRVLEKGVLVNSIYNFPSNMTFFSTSKKLEIGDIPFISHTEKPTRKEALEYYRRLSEKYELNISYQSRVNEVKKEGDIFILGTTRKQFLAKHIIVSTGFYDLPRMLSVEGEHLPKVKHYYDDAHPYIGAKIVVVGGANSACDVALETWSKGADVTLVVRQPELYHKVKYWILPNIQNRIKEGSIKAYFSSNVKAIRPYEVDIETPEGAITIENDYVLSMTGYLPDFEFMQSLGINLDKEHKIPQHNPETLESNVPSIYIAGVIAAGKQTSKLFIENTRDHADLIIQDIVTKKSESLP
jgi:thioredoxin reductase (NADPH)